MNKTIISVKTKTITKEAQNESNSGLIIDDIKSNLKTIKNCWDLEGFPIDSDKIEGLILTNVQPLSFTNYGPIYHSMDNIRELGFNHVEELMGKFVAYDKVLDTGKHYFGYTSDYGQRGMEHSLTNKSGEYEHYEDFRKYGRCFIRILAVRNTKRYAKEIEEEFIADFVKTIFKEAYPNANIHNFSRKEVAQMVSHRLYNKLLPLSIYE